MPPSGSDSYDPNFPSDLDIHPSINLDAQYRHQNVSLLTNFSLDAQEQAIREYGIAGRVWEAAYAMITFICPPSDLEFDTPLLQTTGHDRYTMVELGSGSGLVASVAAGILKPGRDCFIATDLPEVCNLLKKNLPKTLFNEDIAPSQSVLRVCPLSWGNERETKKLATRFFTKEIVDNARPLTHIICSDLVYFPELLAPLLRSLIQLTSPPFIEPDDSVFQPTIYISYKVRSLVKETAFWSAFGLWFSFRPVLSRRRAGSGISEWTRLGEDFDDTTFLFVASRRSGSCSWRVPEADNDLLGGVGAYNNDLRKGDDTFENLLLMSLG